MKKAAKKKSGSGRENLTVVLESGVGAVPATPSLKKNAAAGTPDRIRWSNETDRGHTMVFTVWPFAEPPQSIPVEAGRKSGWFTVYAGTPSGVYDYAIDPTINPPSGPPGEPGVWIGD